LAKVSPLVSIIIPNYNHASFLTKRLESIYNQTYTNIEVILLDDHSEDQSLSLLKTYEHHPKTAHLIINKKNSGSPFLQWKKGINLAKGKYIWIAESDDWARLNFLEKLMPILEFDKEIVLAYCQSKKVNQEGKVIDDMIRYTDIFSPNKWRNTYINSGNEEIQNYLVYKNTIPNASAVVFRNQKDIIKNLRIDMKMAGDWWFWVNIIKGKMIAFIPERLNFHRSHANSTRVNLSLANKFENIQERLEVLKVIQTFHPNLTTKIADLKKVLISELLLWVSPKDYKKVYSFVLQTFSTKDSFGHLLRKAYLYWFNNKIIAVKRRPRYWQYNRTIK